ncbi:MAG: class I SAM-dependent methyltransferase [Haloglomus sp.]
MEELDRTLDAYEDHVDHFVEKFLGTVLAERTGEEFREAMPGTRLLDTGCGPGPDAAVFANEGLDVTGLDLSHSFLETARGRVPTAGFVRGDMRRLPFRDDHFDGVWCCAALVHLPRGAVPGTLAEFGRVLDTGGAAFVTVLHGDDSGYNEEDRYFEQYRPAELRERLETAGFTTRRVGTEGNWVQTLAVRK